MKNGQPPAPELEELARRMRDGDRSAFDVFLNRAWVPLVGYLTPILGTADDAKDVAQEAFIRVWEQRAGLRPAASVRAYVYQIARNLAINELKSRELHRTLNMRRTAERPSAHTLARELETAELRAVVERAIASLPERRREAFVLAHLQNLPHREVAEIMGISPQTVANQISAALSDLRESLRPHLADTSGSGLAGTA